MRSIRYYFGVLAINNVCKNYNQRNFDDYQQGYRYMYIICGERTFFSHILLDIEFVKKGMGKNYLFIFYNSLVTCLL